MKFAEFHVGQVLEAGPWAVTQDEVLAFATQWDPQWFHTQPEAAAHGPFNGLIASGWHTCGIAMRLAAEALLTVSESLASPGLDKIRWPEPVRPGDTLRLRCTVNDVRRSRSQPQLGILTWRWQLFNQNDAEVLSIDATSLFDTVRNANPPV